MRLIALAALAAALPGCATTPAVTHYTHEIRDLATWQSLAARPQSSTTGRTEVVKGQRLDDLNRLR